MRHLVLLKISVLAIFIVSICDMIGNEENHPQKERPLMNKQNDMKWDIRTICFIGVMAALVYVVTMVRIPFLGSKVHFANAFCLLSGMLLGPVPGGLAAGIGSAFYDVYPGSYDLANVLITFVSKFAMAWVCAQLMPRREDTRLNLHRTVIASAIGAVTYVFLYMLKTYVYQRIVYGFPLDAVGVTMWSKFIPSLINALFAVIVAPILYHALKPALRAIGVRR